MYVVSLDGWAGCCRQELLFLLSDRSYQNVLHGLLWKHVPRPLTRTWVSVSCPVTASLRQSQTLGIGGLFKVSRVILMQSES